MMWIAWRRNRIDRIRSGHRRYKVATRPIYRPMFELLERRITPSAVGPDFTLNPIDRAIHFDPAQVVFESSVEIPVLLSKSESQLLANALGIANNELSGLLARIKLQVIADSSDHLLVTGSLQADPDTTFFIQLFAHSPNETGGLPPNNTLLASFELTTNDHGDAIFQAAVNQLNLAVTSISAEITVEDESSLIQLLAGEHENRDEEKSKDERREEGEERAADINDTLMLDLAANRTSDFVGADQVFLFYPINTNIVVLVAPIYGGGGGSAAGSGVEESGPSQFKMTFDGSDRSLDNRPIVEAPKYDAFDNTIHFPSNNAAGATRDQAGRFPAQLEQVSTEQVGVVAPLLSTEQRAPNSSGLANFLQQTLDNALRNPHLQPPQSKRSLTDVETRNDGRDISTPVSRRTDVEEKWMPGADETTSKRIDVVFVEAEMDVANPMIRALVATLATLAVHGHRENDLNSKRQQTPSFNL